jgi:GAG-polyprotein viral zinc-finger/Zinc knuckle
MSIPVFSEPVTGTAGSYKKWLNWRTRFTALLGGKGVVHALSYDGELDEAMNDPDDVDHAVMMEAVSANKKAWYLLVNALSGEPFDLIFDTPGCHVGRAWRLLTAKYEREGTNDLPYLMRELHECKWRTRDVDPSLWLADMRAIDRRIVAAGGQAKSENEWLALIRSNTELPEFQQLYIMLDVAQQTRLADWEREIVNLWNNRRDPRAVPTASGHMRHGDAVPNAAYAAAVGNQPEPVGSGPSNHGPGGGGGGRPPRFGGRPPIKCFRCGKPNHRAHECKAKYHVDGTWLGPNNVNQGQQADGVGYVRPPLRCYSCGEIGHTSRDCPYRNGQTQAAPVPEATLSNHEVDVAELYFAGNVELKEPEGDNQVQVKLEHDDYGFVTEYPTEYEWYLSEMYPDKPEIQKYLLRKNGRDFVDFPGYWVNRPPVDLN